MRKLGKLSHKDLWYHFEVHGSWSSYLVMDKQYLSQRKIGSSKCGKWQCKVYNNATDATIFGST